MKRKKIQNIFIKMMDDDSKINCTRTSIGIMLNDTRIPMCTGLST